MHVVNIMFSRGAGGIEQAVVDYCRAQQLFGHNVSAITYPGAWANEPLKNLRVPVYSMRNFGEWDLFAAYRLRKLLHKLNPDVVIAQANRAIRLSHNAIKGIYPLVGVANNYQTRRFNLVDAAFAPTRDLTENVIGKGTARDKVFHIPNMIACNMLPLRKPRNHPPIVGTMGRFVAKKGFDIYIEALRLLKEQGFAFHAILAGDGEEKPALERLIQKAKLEDVVSMPGWINDREAFYRSIDIFCLPSLHEPFGIVLLEAFAAGVPVVATNTEGPHDIITPNYDAVIVEKGKADALAAGIGTLLIDEARAASFAANAYGKVKNIYTHEAVGQRIDVALRKIVGGA